MNNDLLAEIMAHLEMMRVNGQISLKDPSDGIKFVSVYAHKIRQHNERLRVLVNGGHTRAAVGYIGDAETLVKNCLEKNEEAAAPAIPGLRQR